MLTIGFRRLLVGGIVFSAAAAAQAGEGKDLNIDRLRAYLIYEDSGELSKNIASTEDQIVANDEKGTSVQMLVDVVVAGPGDQIFESNPKLRVIARSQFAEAGAKPLVDTEFPISFMSTKGELSRTVVVDHGCNGFDLEAFIMEGDKRLSEFKKSYSITCGD